MKRNSIAVIGSLFVISGMCGLIYEIVWAKYLSLFIGNTTHAQTIVLASFMAGLMAGSYVIGRFADRTGNTLRLYAFLEIGIGLYCLAFPVILALSESLYLDIATAWGLGPGSASLVPLKLILSLMTMIFPTFLMGGTLPVLVRFITRKIELAGREVATLYWINSLGAIVGAGLAGFFLIKALGLASTIVVAATANILVGIIALILPRFPQWIPEINTPAKGAQKAQQPASRKIITVVLLTAGLSGFVSMVYELGWVRLLSPVLGSSTYSFSLMLVAFISGITVGSLLISKFFHKVKNPVRFLVVCQLGSGVAMILALPLYERLPYYFWKMSSLFEKTADGFSYFLGAQFLFCFLIMFVPTVLLGMSLPTVSRIASTNLTVLGRTIGDVFAINTLGTVAGVVMAGLVMIPLLGIKLSMEIGILMNLLIGFMILFAERRSVRGKTSLVLIPALVFAGYKLLSPAWSPQVMSAGVFGSIHRTVPASYENFKQQYQRRQVLYYKEGLHANVAVILYRGPGGMEKTLIINGKPDASSLVDLSTQVCLAQVPLLLRPDTGNVLVIGLGSGVTVGSVLTHPVKRVDCVEISPEVVEASQLFVVENGNCLADSRVQLYLEDAHSFLKLTRRMYDVIISEPSNPWIAGIGNLFSKEYFEQCSRKLTEKGVLVQWFHTYDMDDEVFQMVMHTFTTVFPHAVIFHPGVGDILILGSNASLDVDVSELGQRMEIAEVKRDLKRIAIHNIPTFLSLQMTSESRMRSLGSRGTLNTEDRPLLEYLAPRGVFTGSEATLLREYDERKSGSTGNLWLHDYERTNPITVQECINAAQYHMHWAIRDYEIASSFLDRALLLAPQDSAATSLKSLLTRMM
jgi:spermidine synthase